MSVKLKTKRLSEHYRAELRIYLTQRPRPGLLAAQKLGREAVALRLETLELARIHERALVSPEFLSGKNGWRQRAETFFNEANRPIQATLRAARRTTVHLSRLQETLAQRAEELAATHRQLKRSVIRRQGLEAVLKQRGRHHRNALEESLQLQKRLRQLTHRVLATQEDERQTIGRQLHDDIAQTLLGINVRLLSLKQEARHHSAGFKRKIATTQRLVGRSIHSVRRVAREINS